VEINKTHVATETGVGQGTSKSVEGIANL